MCVIVVTEQFSNRAILTCRTSKQKYSVLENWWWLEFLPPKFRHKVRVLTDFVFISFYPTSERIFNMALRQFYFQFRYTFW